MHDTPQPTFIHTIANNRIISISISISYAPMSSDYTSRAQPESNLYRYLAHYYCPIWYFHSDERYFPSSVEYSISHAQLLFVPNAISTIEADNARQHVDLFHNTPTHDIQRRVNTMVQCCNTHQHNVHRQYRM